MLLVDVGRGGIAVPTGALMIDGGGMAGVPASWDLADQGFQRYLVQDISVIGGESTPHPEREDSRRMSKIE